MMSLISTQSFQPNFNPTISVHTCRLYNTVGTRDNCRIGLCRCGCYWCHLFLVRNVSPSSKSLWLIKDFLSISTPYNKRQASVPPKFVDPSTLNGWEVVMYEEPHIYKAQLARKRVQKIGFKKWSSNTIAQHISSSAPRIQRANIFSLIIKILPCKSCKNDVLMIPRKIILPCYCTHGKSQ